MKKFLALIEKEIRKQKFGRKPDSLYEPIRYIMSLGGKRLRPMLVLLSYSLYKKNPESIIKYATVVEAFHNFTLMHDDIMDKAPLRRGKPTVHEKWNVNTAILAGDVMLVKVYDLFLDLPEKKLIEVLKAFNKCAAEVCEGQQWDMEFESKAKVTEREYLEMIRLKTAVLLGFSLELGAILADAPEADRKALREFGINLGIGFQLKDDWLDVYADKKKFGKQVGGDIISNKKTFLLIKALEKSIGNTKKELMNWLSAKKFNKQKKVIAVTLIYNSLKIGDLTEKKAADYFIKAFKSIDQLSLNERSKELKFFASNLIARES
jgi:geranylgeranyl diphosphate synthase type II